jgi:hypothetical protein
MSTPAPAPAPQPQFIIVQSGGSKMSALQKVQLAVLLAGIGFGGYAVYEIFFTEGGACEGTIFGKNGVIGRFFPYNPLCEVSSVLGFFKDLKLQDAGVPLQLDDCPAGWVNDGLTCREPISCKSAEDCFSGKGCGCSGGNVRGRLDGGGKCPADHPDKIVALCYQKCPAGYTHTEGMPYTCRSEKKGNFLDAIKSGFNF